MPNIFRKKIEWKTIVACVQCKRIYVILGNDYRETIDCITTLDYRIIINCKGKDVPPPKRSIVHDETLSPPVLGFSWSPQPVLGKHCRWSHIHIEYGETFHLSLGKICMNRYQIYQCFSNGTWGNYEGIVQKPVTKRKSHFLGSSSCAVFLHIASNGNPLYSPLPIARPRH